MRHRHGHSPIFERAGGIDALILEKDGDTAVHHTVDNWCPPFIKGDNVVIINRRQNFSVTPERLVFTRNVTSVWIGRSPVENYC